MLARRWSQHFPFSSSPCLHPLLLPLSAPLLWPIVLAAGSKPAVHLMSNVLYHSPLCSLKWFSCCPRALTCSALEQTHNTSHAGSVTRTCVVLADEINAAALVSQMIQHPFHSSGLPVLSILLYPLIVLVCRSQGGSGESQWWFLAFSL